MDSDKEMRTKPPSNQVKRLHYIGTCLMLTLILWLFTFAGFQMLEKSRYIKLEIPSPISDLPNGGWSYSEYSTRMPDTLSSGGYYIWRQETRAYGSHDIYKFDTIENVVAYFRDWLATYGWMPVDVPSPCNKLPGYSGYSNTEGAYFEYRKAGVDPFRVGPKVCLAVWNISYDREIRFLILLQTENPSFWVRLGDAFE